MAKKIKEEVRNVDSVVLKNGHVGTYAKEGILFKLLNVPLHGQQSRSRNRILKQISLKRDEIEKDRVSIMEGYAEKEVVDGKEVVKLTEDGQYDINTEGLIKANEGYRKLMDEDYIIDILPSNKVDLRTVKTIIEESLVSFGTNDGADYDDICEGFEVAFK